MIQGVAGTPAVVTSARTLSHVGEHALGWLVLGVMGISASRGARRREWIRAVESVAAAHAAAVLIKRVIRRPRPDDPRIRVLVGTPSRLSFPSAHVSSTTAAAVAYGPLLAVGPVAPAAVAATMGLSRLVLGVHFPTDVAVGALVGWAVAVMLRRAGRETVTP